MEAVPVREVSIRYSSKQSSSVIGKRAYEGPDQYKRPVPDAKVLRVESPNETSSTAGGVSERAAYGDSSEGSGGMGGD